MTGEWLAHLAIVFLAALVTDNVLLTRFFGICSFVAISKHLRTAAGMGVAVVFVTLCTALLDWAIYWGILTPGAPLCPVDLTYLHLVVFILSIAAFVQLVEMIVERVSPVLHIRLGIYLPLITVNCAILGVNLLMIRPDTHGATMTLSETGVFALASGLGWMLAICLMAGLRAKLAHAPVPAPLRGLGITMLSAGFMAAAFLGFRGVGEGIAAALAGGAP